MAIIHFETNSSKLLFEKLREEGYANFSTLEEIVSFLNTIKEKNYSLYKKIHPFFLGALGEKKAVEELSRLSDDYHIVNNVYFSFSPPIYNRKDDDIIHSIQIDHLVIGPTGLFNIETKNWGDNSLSNKELFSPVKQIKRHGYILYKIINYALKEKKIILKSHH